MNQSRLLASLLVTGALAATTFAQSSNASSNASGAASPATPRANRPAASSPSDLTTPAATPAPATDTTTPSLNPVSPDASATSTPSGPANSSRANTNADLSATAGFYGPGASQFKNIDTDADGRISRAEFTLSASTAATLTLDKNHDGIVSTEERAATTTTGEKKHWWSRSDKAAGDTDPTETFNKLDADNDGFLSQNELASANAKLKK